MSDLKPWVDRFQALAAEQGLKVLQLKQELREVHSHWDDDVDDRSMEAQSLRDEIERLSEALRDP